MFNRIAAEDTSRTASSPQAHDSASRTYASMMTIALVIFLAVTFLPGGEVANSAERFARMDAAFAAIPAWVKQWMSFQHYVFAGSLLFIIWHVEARVYLCGLVLSHAISYGEIVLAPVDRLGLGLVSLNHLVWLPALVFMVRRYGALEKQSPFGLWYHLVLFQLCFSLIFDIRDSSAYLWSMVS
jgi:hypothetical protein